MNICVMCGRLTREPQITYTQGQNPMCVAKFTLAVDRFKKDEADFIQCTAFGKNAEFAEKYLTKGTKIITNGRWQTGSYKNKDGQMVYTNDLIIDHVEFAESKKESDQNTPQTDDGFISIPDGITEELPFK